MNTAGLADGFFRHEYAWMVATLARRLGVHHMEVIEDAVQSALMSALDRWKRTGAPDNPSAWLFRVALNKALDELRTGSRRNRLASQQALTEVTEARNASESHLLGEVLDDLLRMLFVCCDESLPSDSQLALALKTLCGFSVAEIAQRLFTSEASIYKRIEGASLTGPYLDLTTAEGNMIAMARIDSDIDMKTTTIQTRTFVVVRDTVLNGNLIRIIRPYAYWPVPLSGHIPAVVHSLAKFDSSALDSTDDNTISTMIV